MGIGGLGIGDWGLGIGPNPQSPIPNPQSPIPNPQSPIPNPQSPIPTLLIINSILFSYSFLLFILFLKNTIYLYIFIFY